MESHFELWLLIAFLTGILVGMGFYPAAGRVNAWYQSRKALPQEQKRLVRLIKNSIVKDE